MKKLKLKNIAKSRTEYYSNEQIDEKNLNNHLPKKETKTNLLKIYL